MHGCVTLLEAGLRRETSSRLTNLCPSLNVRQAHPHQHIDRVHDAPPETELPPLERTCSHHHTKLDAPQGAHENLPELSSKTDFPRNTGTNTYITIVKGFMSMAQPNKLMTA